MHPPGTRWVQRFANFERTFLLLRDALAIESPSLVERTGIIQFFELAFELAWKVMKDYEEAEGIVVKTPREAINQGFQIGLIAHGHGWMSALQDRNLTTYSEATAIALESSIRNDYFPLLAELYNALKAKADG